MQFVEATCVDVSTDWVPLFDVEVIVDGEVMESHRAVRGFTELDELAASRGWVRKTPSFQIEGSTFGRPATGADGRT